MRSSAGTESTVAEVDPETIMGYCTECGRPIRKRSLTAADAPGTLAHGANGVCITDYNRRRGHPDTEEQRARRREILRDKQLGTYRSRAQVADAEEKQHSPKPPKRVGFELSGDDRTVGESVARRDFGRDDTVDLLKMLGILPRDAA